MSKRSIKLECEVLPDRLLPSVASPKIQLPSPPQLGTSTQYGSLLPAFQPSANKVSLTRGQQLTYDQEGIRLAPYHPTATSGVTIGVGYDMLMRSRSSIIADLTNAGVDKKTAEKLAGGAGLTGKKADDFVKDNAKLAITTEQAKSLFLPIYADKEATVHRIVGEQTVVDKYGKTDWGRLNQKIKDVLIDMAYRGDYIPATRTYIQKYVVANDLEGFTKAVSDKSIFPSNLSQRRFDARINYLKS